MAGSCDRIQMGLLCFGEGMPSTEYHSSVSLFLYTYTQLNNFLDYFLKLVLLLVFNWLSTFTVCCNF